jgi:hypothetical protein
VPLGIVVLAALPAERQTASNYFAGQIDELCVYPLVRGAQVVRNHYQAGRFWRGHRVGTAVFPADSLTPVANAFTANLAAKTAEKTR